MTKLSYEDRQDLKTRFGPPKTDQPPLYTTLHSRAMSLARMILLETPKSREQSLALTKLEEAVMWANAAIARHE